MDYNDHCSTLMTILVVSVIISLVSRHNSRKQRKRQMVTKLTAKHAPKLERPTTIRKPIHSALGSVMEHIDLVLLSYVNSDVFTSCIMLNGTNRPKDQLNTFHGSHEKLFAVVG
jgi:hypothetical protein